MEFKFEKPVEINYYASDNRMNMSFSALIAFFQDIAIDHSDSAGYTVKRLLDEGLGWIITNYHIIIERMPKYGEKVVFKTWSSGIKHFQAERSYSVTDSNGNEIVKAASMWVLIDLEKRTPVSIPDEMNKAYKTGTAPAIENERFRITKKRGELVSVFETKITRRQTDTNGHTNNTQYVSWAMDMICDEIYNNYNCVDFKVTFRKESRKDEEIIIKTYKTKTDEGLEFETDITDKEENILCSAVSVWRE